MGVQGKSRFFVITKTNTDSELELPLYNIDFGSSREERGEGRGRSNGRMG